MLRILKPGGTIRTVWPSMDFVDFLKSDKDLSQNPFVQNYYKMYVKHTNFCPAGNEHKSKQEQCILSLLYQNGEHKHLWYVKEMIEILISLGYKNVKQMEYGISNNHDFTGIDTDDEIRKIHSSVVEATKP